MFSDKASLDKSFVRNFIFKWHLLSELCQASFDGVCTPIVVRREWMSVCLQFFAATTVDNLFGNLDLLKNVGKSFLIDIMRHNNIDTDVNEIKQPC